jgi:hypothetical protein
MDQIIGTDSAVSLIVPQVWSRRYYDVLLAELPFASLISTDYEGEISNLGDTVKISTVPEFGECERQSCPSPKNTWRIFMFLSKLRR